MFLSHSKSGLRSNEDVFFAYYQRLSEWALQITRHDKSEAEDLVQDFYLCVTRVARPLDEAEQLDQYLFRVLRNLYYGRLRRAKREPIDNLSIVDYDSIEQGLAAMDRRELLFVRSHLQMICRYACQRKSTNRSAGILILRFFLGYYPSELMKIVRVPRYLIDQALHVARNEARIYLQRPASIQSILLRKEASGAIKIDGSSDDSHDLFLKLRKAIHQAVDGRCFSPEEIAKRYEDTETPSSLTAQELSHLVSCPVCLDQVNTLLGLELLDQRSPEYGLDREGPGGPAGGANSGHTSDTKWKRIANKREALLHKLQRRARDLYEHRPKSLEIVMDGDARSSQKVTAEINELRLGLKRQEQPTFVEVFSEQGFRLIFLEVVEPVSADKLEQIETAYFSNDRSLVLTVSFAAEGPTVHVLYRDPVMAESRAGEMNSLYTNEPLPESSLHRQWSIHRLAIGLIARLRDTFATRVNLPLAGIPVVAVVIPVCLWLWPRQQVQPITPIALLQHAEVAENVPRSGLEPKIVYQKVSIQTQKRTLKRDIYRDPSGRRKPKPEELDSQTIELKNELRDAGVDWNEPLSAATYQGWRDRSQVVKDTVQETGQDLLTLTTTVSSASITQESLTIRKSDFHPIARSVSYRDTGVVEIAELDYAVLGWTPGFEPLFESSGSSASAVTSTLQHLPDPEQLDITELQIRQELHEQGADLGEDIHIARSPRNITVSGVVSNSSVAHSLRASLSRIPHVALALSSPEELHGKRSVATEAQPSTEQSDLESPLLEEQLTKSIPNDVARTQLIDHLLAEADECRWHARALDVLLQRYRSLEDPRVKQLAEDHLQALARSSAAIAAWIDTLSNPLDESQYNIEPSSQVAQGNQLTDESHKLEHDMAELLTAHPADGTSPRSAASVAASCQRHVKTIQRLIIALR